MEEEEVGQNHRIPSVAHNSRYLPAIGRHLCIYTPSRMQIKLHLHPEIVYPAGRFIVDVL